MGYTITVSDESTVVMDMSSYGHALLTQGEAWAVTEQLDVFEEESDKETQFTKAYFERDLKKT